MDKRDFYVIKIQNFHQNCLSFSNSRKSVSEDDKTSQCLQVVYHPGIRHVVFMVYPTQVDIIDVEVCIVVSTIRLDSKSSLFVRVSQIC